MNLHKKYINVLYWIAMAGLLFWFVYSKGWILANFESIDAKQAIHLLENDGNVTLLDVRTIQEYKSGHLRDATLIPVQALSKNLGMLKQDKNKKIIVYCRTGSRSVSASRILEENGFTPLNVKGGIIQLIGAGVTLVQ
ncbi:rhodanese-like domain-containing protein [Sulfurovum sp.]|uniref:rhodanese-like domain-containing protein n=1 Tax=Sulfurovum sp. TaxID=1969726 RepID=UPI002868141B|nr:rhodanese-like domain-containing protein [Sulfurovum sp.]